jgi:hypothetical protein
MENLYSVFIFSKYSSNCKKMFDMLKNSRLQPETIKLQMLCVDNDQVRKRILSNNQIDIKTVPCILSVFNNGAVEKYESQHAFAWVENMINKYAPPPQQSFQQAPQPQAHQPVIQHLPPAQRPIHQPIIIDEERTEIEEDDNVKLPVKKTLKVPKRMKAIEATSIDDIPMDDEQESDRHRNRPVPKRIRQDEGEYIEDDTLFSGEVVDHRREPSNVVRSSASERRVTNDTNGIKAKADALAKGRDDIDRELSNKSGRPLVGQRP